MHIYPLMHKNRDLVWWFNCGLENKGEQPMSWVQAPLVAFPPLSTFFFFFFYKKNAIHGVGSLQ